MMNQIQLLLGGPVMTPQIRLLPEVPIIIPQIHPLPGGPVSLHLKGDFPHSGKKTVFRDKSGQKRNLKVERLEQRRKAEKDSEGDELYAHWGKGLGQSRQQQQNVEDAMKEMQKPLARYIDDEDLDRMLREQEREGDPMADFIKKNNAEENKHKKAGPRYNGPAPPPIDSESGLDTAGREWTGPMASNRSALPGSPARRLWRSLPTSGVWRTCSFSKAVRCCGGGGPGQPDIQL
ncbi:BUD13-like protein [Microtus ochrogaster]|uniref:BUD13 homolog n=1 Tax=Microtus ochrogaster TaxID=79684 RepID=A0A8J6G2C2_MICOH|nr:BUD13-like protein [Microtus ochrogaster]